MLKLILVDDQEVVRAGLKCWLENGINNFKIVGEAISAEELFIILPDTAVDIVLMDICLPGMDGLAATEYLKKHYPALKVVILSIMDNEQYVAQALAAGAQGYLTKAATRVELVEALQIVAAGNKYITPEVSSPGLERIQSLLNAGNNYAALSKQELKVLHLIVQGHTTIEIADMLFNSKRTIETHRKHILRKTNSKNTANLIAYAYRNHLLEEQS